MGRRVGRSLGPLGQARAFGMTAKNLEFRIDTLALDARGLDIFFNRQSERKN
jgi:hypothetical protein